MPDVIRVTKNEATAARRRVYFYCVDVTDGMTPEAGEAGGQPQISVDGAAFTNTGVGVLVAQTAANGRYYAVLTQTIVNVDDAIITTRYKSANTAEIPGTTVQIDGLIQDIDDEVDEIHTAVHNITVTGAALNQIAESYVATTGGETGTYANTALDDGSVHTITESGNEIDGYYQFDIGASGTPVSAACHGWLQESPAPGGDTIDLWAYDWGNTTFEVVQVAFFTGITSAGPAEDASATLLARHVGTGGNEGKVRLRFYSTTLEGGGTLNIDQLFISYAESTAASIALILEDTAELQVDNVDGGRTDLLVDAILLDTGTTIPAVLGTPTDTDLATDIANIGGTAGPGNDNVTITIQDDDEVDIPDVTVWITSDLAGTDTIASVGTGGESTTDDDGEITFLLDAGTTYYRWARKSGVDFTNPTAFVAVAD